MPAVDAAEFTPYGTTHQLAVVLLVAGAVVLVVLGRRLRERDPGDRLGKGLAVVLLLVTLPLQVVYFTPGYWNLSTSLPLQLCDLGLAAAAYALWTHRRWAAGLTYYRGLTLTTQAVATPDLAATFPSPVFLLFWMMHIGTVWAAVYLTWGRGVVPSWRTYRTAVLVTAGWVVVILAFNAVAGTNYGYLNAKPSAGSVLDLLGPWPWYVVAEAAIVAAVWALATWPWERRRPQHAPHIPRSSDRASSSAPRTDSM